ncbi:MAG: Panacea domain-containing protein [Bacteroidales bacterium]
MMKKTPYTTFSEEQLSKIGNTIIYLAGRISDLSKTKLLKLLYILDESAIQKTGIPFLNLQYKVWKFGPVAEELFVDLSSEVSLLKDFIAKSSDGNNTITAIKEFDDAEFSDFDINLMDSVVKDYGKRSAKDLIAYTHKESSLWYKLAKENNVLSLLESEKVNTTDLCIDLAQLLEHEPIKKSIYLDYIETH